MICLPVKSKEILILFSISRNILFILPYILGFLKEVSKNDT